eukprot:362070-Chlamydomonas_euryale.AAC.7
MQLPWQARAAPCFGSLTQIACQGRAAPLLRVPDRRRPAVPASFGVLSLCSGLSTHDVTL